MIDNIPVHISLKDHVSQLSVPFRICGILSEHQIIDISSNHLLTGILFFIHNTHIMNQWSKPREHPIPKHK